jgi:N-acetyl-1-D-myo-inositol-2-amino-2-deoxy-alpha-D-glucopyranoside deacetylase
LRALALIGHPDDEVSFTGTLAAIRAAGGAVTVVSATRGELGTIIEPELATPTTLGYVRELELRAAMGCIGVSDVRFLGFRDSGLAGAASNKDAEAFASQPPDVAAKAIHAIMRELRPGLVFTADPLGDYGHPDHVTVHRRAVEAFELARSAGDLPPEARLYWPPAEIRKLRTRALESVARQLPGSLGGAVRRLQWRTERPVSHIVDVAAFVEAKLAAAHAHRTQLHVDNKLHRVPEAQHRTYFASEPLVLGMPRTAPGAVLRGDFRILLPREGTAPPRSG